MRRKKYGLIRSLSSNQQVAYLSLAAWKYGIYQALGEHSC